MLTKIGRGEKVRNVFILAVIAMSFSDVAILKYEIATVPLGLRNDTVRTFSPLPDFYIRLDLLVGWIYNFPYSIDDKIILSVVARACFNSQRNTFAQMGEVKNQFFRRFCDKTFHYIHIRVDLGTVNGDTEF